MGPLWDNNDAVEKARIWVSQNPGWRYTGEWRTTIPNVMSTITVEMDQPVMQPMMQPVVQPMMQPVMQPQMMVQQPVIAAMPQTIIINNQPQ